MTTIILTPDLEESITEQARQQGTTPEALVLETLREKFKFIAKPQGSLASLDDWERQISAAAVQVESARTDA